MGGCGPLLRRNMRAPLSLTAPRGQARIARGLIGVNPWYLSKVKEHVEKPIVTKADHFYRVNHNNRRLRISDLERSWVAQ